MKNLEQEMLQEFLLKKMKKEWESKNFKKLSAERILCVLIAVIVTCSGVDVSVYLQSGTSTTTTITIIIMAITVILLTAFILLILGQFTKLEVKWFRQWLIPKRAELEKERDNEEIELELEVIDRFLSGKISI